MLEEQRLEEQVLSQAARVGISSQLNKTENIDIDVRTNLLKILLGKADSINFDGKGLTTQEGIRVQELEMHTDNISIDPLSAIFGQLKLNEPINTTIRVVLTEADINQALNSDFVRKQLSPIELNVDGEIVTLAIQQPMSLHLPDGEKMVFSGNMLITEKGQIREIEFNSSFFPRTNEKPALLQGFNCISGQGISVELSCAFMQKLKELVSLPYIELQGIALKIKQLEAQKGSLELLVEAHVYQLPTS